MAALGDLPDDAEPDTIRAAIQQAEDLYAALSDEQKALETVQAYKAALDEFCAANPLDDVVDNANITTEDELRNAIDAAPAGQETVITITGDFALTQQTRIDIKDGKNITLNGNGHTLTRAAETFFIYVLNQSTLTLNNVILDGNNVVGTFSLLYNNGGTLNLFDTTVTNAKTNGSGGAINNRTTFTMNGGAITFCSAEGSKKDGGGLYNGSNASAKISNAVFRNNTANRYGGGVFSNANGKLEIANSTFSDNESGNTGGGVYNAGSLTISGGTFSENQGGGYVGGAVHNTTAATVTGTEFSGNAPGAVSMTGGTITGATITENTGDGPALKLGGTASANNCTITNNQNSQSSTENGGAVFVGSSSNVTLNGCKITNNTGSPVGGVSVYRLSTATFNNTVVKENRAGDGGVSGGIYLDYLANLKFESGALYANGLCDLYREAGSGKLNVLDAVKMVDSEQADHYFIDNNYAWKLTDGTILEQSVSIATETSELTLTAIPQEGGSTGKVYLDGSKGDDANNGSRPTSAVKTLNHALELAKERNIDTIYVSGEVELTGDVSGAVESTQAQDGEEVTQTQSITLKRAEGYKGNLLVVGSGKTASLTDITLDGNSEAFPGGDTGALVKVAGTLTLGEGVTLRNNKVFSYKYPENAGGGVYVSGGTLTIDGATITQCSADLGGAVGAFSGKIVMDSGEISGNTGRLGGGVFVAQTGQFVMNGGTIQGNTANYQGGGICIGSGVGNQLKDGANTLEVHGGTIAGNTASNSGGGIFIQGGQDSVNIGYKALIDGTSGPVYIQNNHALASGGSHFHGGGIYVNGGKTNSDGYLKLECAVITGNSAAQGGGGFAGCGTSDTAIYFRNGGAIFGNNGDDFLAKNVEGSGVFVAPSINISSSMLGGGQYNWKFSDNDKEVPLDRLTGWGDINMNANPSQEDIVAANSVARVFITDNTTNGRGGGIGSNGIVQIGDAPTYEAVEFKVTKVWDDKGFESERPQEVTVAVERSLDQATWSTLGTVTLNSTKDWSTVIKNLLLNAWNSEDMAYTGAAYYYRVTETPVKNYQEGKVTGGMEDGFTITNTYNPAKLTLRKAVSGGTEEARTSKEYSFTVTGPNDFKKDVTIKGQGSETLELIPGEYTVTENVENAGLDGYKLTVTNNEATVKAGAGKTVEVTITNTYQPSTQPPVIIITPPATPTPTPTPTPAPTATPTPEPTDEPIEDPDVPLGTPEPTPTPEPTDEPTPTPDPSDEPIEDPDVPLGTPKPAPTTKPTPVPDEEIPDGDVPKGNVPKTGDDIGIWMTLALVSAAGLIFLGASRRKGENVR